MTNPFLNFLLERRDAIFEDWKTFLVILVGLIIILSPLLAAILNWHFSERFKNLGEQINTLKIQNEDLKGKLEKYESAISLIEDEKTRLKNDSLTLVKELDEFLMELEEGEKVILSSHKDKLTEDKIWNLICNFRHRMLRDYLKRFEDKVHLIRTILSNRVHKETITDYSTVEKLISSSGEIHMVKKIKVEIETLVNLL